MPNAPTTPPVSLDALTGRTELAEALADALDRLALAFPGKRAEDAREIRQEVYLDAVDGCDPAALPAAVKRVIQESKYFPSGSELRAAVVEEQRRRSEAGIAGPHRGASPAWTGAPWDVCPHCLTPPMIRAVWTPVTCRGHLPAEATAPGDEHQMCAGAARRPACDHPVHRVRAPDGGRGRHVEWRLALELTSPPRCSCWEHVWRAGAATTSRVAAAHVPHELVRFAIARADLLPTIPAGPTVPADYAERTREVLPDPAARVEVAHG